MTHKPSRRSRGVILTLKGWDKLQAAKSEAEFKDNNNNNRERFSVEELSDRMILSLHTVSRIMGRSEPVDKSSLQSAFAAFGLKLCQSDYTRPIPERKPVQNCQPCQKCLSGIFWSINRSY